MSSAIFVFPVTLFTETPAHGGYASPGMVSQWGQAIQRLDFSEFVQHPAPLLDRVLAQRCQVLLRRSPFHVQVRPQDRVQVSYSVQHGPRVFSTPILVLV